MWIRALNSPNYYSLKNITPYNNYVCKDHQRIKCMSENLHVVTKVTREEEYQSVLPQIKALIYGESDLIANLANISAALKQQFDFLWIGFYLIKNNELVLGPFQGPIACTRITFNKGVCGAAWAQQQTIIVEDVEQFPGHIACSSFSKSEIVVPLLKNNQCIGVLDIDSESLATFDEIDKKYLEELVSYIDY